VKLEYKPQFFDDLDDIAEYIKSNFSGEFAQSVVQDIYNECRALADTPNRGRVYSRNTYFKYLIIKKKNILFFHINDDAITLHRIFDSRRDYAAAVASLNV
jgi:plasmid stabilization system protein ParE